MYENIKKSRLYVIFIFFLLFFLIFLTRLFYIQVVSTNKLSKIAKNQYKKIIELPAHRGNIYDRFHRPLALTMPVYSMYADPSTVKNVNKTARKISNIIDVSLESLKKKMRSSGYFVWLKRHIDKQKKNIIKSYHLSGIGFVREKERIYPNGNLAAHVLGYTGIDTQGLGGIEYFLDSKLKGIKGYKCVNVDAIEREIPYLNKKYVKPHKGLDVVLTIDEVIQNIIERFLNKAVKKWHAAGGSIIVMDPSSGEILGMANKPTYNPNEYSKYNAKNRSNRAISYIFEPGSIFKIVTGAAVLEENLVKKDEKIFCENGSYKVHSHIINDYHSFGELTFPGVIINSSNIGTVKLAQRLGRWKLYKYIKLFGFGDETGIKLPGEAKGIIRKPENWSKISIASIPIGQEVGVTALQMICALSVIANEGNLLVPRIVKKIEVNKEAVVKKFTPTIKKRVISEKTASFMRDILTRVVESGTGQKVAIEGIKVAGKTGTAQKIGENGTYSPSKYVASFMGFLPVESPLISIIVVIDEPSPIHFGGSVAAPVFKKVSKAILSYYQVSNSKLLTSN